MTLMLAQYIDLCHVMWLVCIWLARRSKVNGNWFCGGLGASRAVARATPVHTFTATIITLIAFLIAVCISLGSKEALLEYVVITGLLSPSARSHTS